MSPQEQPTKYIYRDISWLSFNHRVMQEAENPEVPLLERVKFLAIYSSNMDEFFRVRVATLRSLIRLDKKERKTIDFNPALVLGKLLVTVNEQAQHFSAIFHQQLLPSLRKEGIYVAAPSELDTNQQAFLRKYFSDRIAPYVQPVLLVKQKIRPFLINGSLYLAVILQEPKSSKEKYAVVRIPSKDTGRFIVVPGEQNLVVFLDDLVRFMLNDLFPGYTVKGAYSFKLTRDAELNITDEYSGDLIAKIKEGLAKRNAGPATRFVYDRSMPSKLLKLLGEIFKTNKEDLIPEGTYHNNADLFGFPDFGRADLKDTPQPPVNHPLFAGNTGILDTIKAQGDILLSFPYQKYDPVAMFFEQAALDPQVREIRITQYRVARQSRIMEALIKAAKLGKKVLAFVEVKARFDEEANLQWAEELERHGVQVLYSFPGLKVHSKLAQVIRLEQGKRVRYTYMSTGNFNETTAKIYADFGLFTQHNEISLEVERVFKFLQTGVLPRIAFKHLWVGQINMYDQLIQFIEEATMRAQAGQVAEITLKLNSIEEVHVIDKLYEAAEAGVKIKLIVRGICCLNPALSPNIEAISIIDRYLEHARVYYFKFEDSDRLLLSSADLMGRNLHHRIECAFPVMEEKLKTEVLHFLHIQWQDNVKARILDGSQSNALRPKGKKAIRSQVALYLNTQKALD